MVDRPKKDEGREHGRRPYVSDKPHFDQMRMRTDAFVARYGRRPHSEDKKPYFDDIDYPEMEHFFFGWDPPLFPPFDPVFPPDEPVDPWGPPTTWPYWPPPPPIEPTTGCLFWPPRFEPFVLTPGETAWANFHVYEGDSLVRLVPHGPIELLTTVQEVGDCRKLSGPRKCLISIRAKGSLEGYGPSPGQSLIQAAVVAELSSGRSCSAEVLISPCDATSAPEWDYSRNPSTVSPPADVTIYLVDNTGVPPFNWATDTGTLTYVRTKTRINFLSLPSGFCGTATVTITDACGRQVSGGIMSTSGGWVLETFTCPYPGPPTAVDPYALGNCWFPTHERIASGVKVRHCHVWTDWKSGCPNPLGGSCSACESLCLSQARGCDQTYGCTRCIDPHSSYPCVQSHLCQTHDSGGACTKCEDGGWKALICLCLASPLQYRWQC